MGLYQDHDMYVEREREELLAPSSPDHREYRERRSIANITIASLLVITVLLTVVVVALVVWPVKSAGKSVVPSLTPPVPEGEVIVGMLADVHLKLDLVGKCAPTPGLIHDYGKFGCDSTEKLLNATLDDMVERLGEEMSVVLMLGDAATHQNVSTWESKVVLEGMGRMFELIEERFPKHAVLPTIGNNDLPEHNGLPLLAWYSLLLDMYQPALLRDPLITLPHNFRDLFMAGGFYQAEYNNSFTVFSLNTNLFSIMTEDVSGQGLLAERQLRWFDHALRKLDGRAIIIGHISPGLNLRFLFARDILQSNWRLPYFEVFREIIYRNEGKIIGMFFGHEHTDMVSLEQHEGKVLAAIGLPSVSPVFSGEPSYSAAVLDRELRLTDVRTYYTWMDFYSRVPQKMRFNGFSSLAEVLGTKFIEPVGMLERLQDIISEEDGMKLYSDLIEKLYQGRTVPGELSPHLFYCYSTSLRTAHFIDCVDNFGYDGKEYVIRSTK